MPVNQRVISNWSLKNILTYLVVHVKLYFLLMFQLFKKVCVIIVACTMQCMYAYRMQIEATYLCLQLSFNLN